MEKSCLQVWKVAGKMGSGGVGVELRIGVELSGILVELKWNWSGIENEWKWEWGLIIDWVEWRKNSSMKCVQWFLGDIGEMVGQSLRHWSICGEKLFTGTWKVVEKIGCTKLINCYYYYYGGYFTSRYASEEWVSNNFFRHLLDDIQTSYLIHVSPILECRSIASYTKEGLT